MTTSCPACRAEAPDGARFCSSCGARLATSVGPLVQERKVVTTLFCDLVSFTRMAEHADPEDVDRILREYADVTRHAVEIHGGLVEKFIGDAVVAVFGVPCAHEDDAERAVHAALRIQRDVPQVLDPEGSSVRVRIGVNTGEVLARVDAAARVGEGFLAGDSVNTAARLQSAAPPGAILIGPTTYALTKKYFRFEELEPVELKGKAEAMPVWQVREAVSRTGADRAADFATAFVGRRSELAGLDALLAEVVREARPTMALITGEPGIGKSRLLAEFYRLLDGRPLEVIWREGRCLPYGEGIAFWPLTEIVRAQAGVLETDDEETVEQKLARTLPDDPDRQWIGDRLRPLVGLKAKSASQSESFSAWIEYISHLATRRPLILVVEDLHWANEAMLAFLQRLVTQESHVPILLLTTARTQFLEDRPEFATTLSPESHLALTPLTEPQIAELLAGLLDDPEALDRLGASIAERCGGNPLYTEEVSHLLRERGLGDQGQKGDATALPQSVQAVIAARIDALPPREKEYLADAAVVGRRFWDGALAALSGDGEELDAGLRGLAAAELIRDASGSTMEGQREFVFWHGLTCDVAYGLLTRDARADKHECLAHWIEGKTGERAGDLADVLAHHYVTALETRQELRDEAAVSRLVDPAATYLLRAGDRAMGLDLASGARYFRRAREILPRDHVLRPRLDLLLGKTLAQMGDSRGAHRVLEDAIEGFGALGSTRDLALAMSELSTITWSVDGDRRSEDLSAAALHLLQDDGPSPELVLVLEACVAVSARHFDRPGVIAIADRAVGLAADMGLDPPVRAMHYRALARCDLGDQTALSDFEQVLETGKELGISEVGGMSLNLVQDVLAYKGPRAAMDVSEEWRGFAARRGDVSSVLGHQCLLTWCLFHAGEWVQAAALAEEIDGELERRAMWLDLEDHRSLWSRILNLQGDTERAAPLAQWAEARCRQGSGNLLDCLVALAGVRLSQGDLETARTLLEELVASTPRPQPVPFALLRPSAARIAAAAGDSKLVSALLNGLVPQRGFDACTLRSGEALIRELSGDPARAERRYAAAASSWERLAVPYESACALLGRGRCLVALGRAPEAASVLERARGIFEGLGARPALGQTEALLNDLT